MVEVQRVEIVFGNVLKVAEVEPPQLGHGRITLKYEQFTITAEGDHVMYALPIDHSVLMQVSYVDAKGNPATIDGEVSWQSSDTALATLQVDPDDSTTVRVVPVGSVGQVQVTARCDADLGEGVRELLTTADIELVGGEAVSGSIQPVGEPEQMTARKK